MTGKAGIVVVVTLLVVVLALYASPRTKQEMPQASS
jgi:hypothetical protein